MRTWSSSMLLVLLILCSCPLSAMCVLDERDVGEIGQVTVAEDVLQGADEAKALDSEETLSIGVDKEVMQPPDHLAELFGFSDRNKLVNMRVNIYYLQAGASKLKQAAMGLAGGYHWAVEIGGPLGGYFEYSFGAFAARCKAPGFQIHNDYCDDYSFMWPEGAYPEQVPWEKLLPGHDGVTDMGIYRSKPTADPAHRMHAQVSLGIKSQREAYEILQQVGGAKGNNWWHSEKYEMFTHNCQTFSLALIEAFGLKTPEVVRNLRKYKLNTESNLVKMARQALDSLEYISP